MAWLNGLVNKENGHLDDAIANFEAALGATSPELQARGFDFSRDYEVLNELARRCSSGPSRSGARRAPRRGRRCCAAPSTTFDRTLAIDPENVTAHYALSLLHGELGDQARAAAHRDAHLRYTPDEQSRSRVLAQHRLANPAANHAAQALVIYDLQRRSAAPSPGDFAVAVSRRGLLRES